MGFPPTGFLAIGFLAIVIFWGDVIVLGVARVGEIGEALGIAGSGVYWMGICELSL